MHKINPVIIGLDFDNCYIMDCDLWENFIKQAVSRGHKVYCITGRTNNSMNREEMAKYLPIDLPIIFCNHLLKRAEALRQGIKVDIWIDDLPEVIGESRGSS